MAPPIRWHGHFNQTRAIQQTRVIRRGSESENAWGERRWPLASDTPLFGEWDCCDIGGTHAAAFLSQVVDYDDVELEKLHAFLKMLLPRLRGQEDDVVSIDGAVRLARYKPVNRREHVLDLAKGEATTLKPFGPGGGAANEDPQAKLSEIIRKIHGLFAGKFTDPEIAGWFTAVVGNTVADERIQVQAKANPTEQQFANGDFKTVLAEAVIKALASHHSMSDQMLQNPKVFDDMAELLLPEVYETARQASQAIS